MKRPACVFPLFASIASVVLANTEKVVFTAPPRDTLSELYNIKDEAFHTLTPSQSVLRTSLAVAFPNVDRPNGLDSWYRLEELEEDRRYEVRVCWAATQPTAFTLDVYASGDGAGSVLLIQSAADFFSTNATLMQHPPPVIVDIILDPYLANVFPQSLVLTAVYIVALAVVGFFVSGALWRALFQPSVSASKRHVE